MSQAIHVRNTADGKRYRVWSDNVDRYLTHEMTEAEIREWTLKAAVCFAIEEHLRGIDARIQRAQENGTSSFIGNDRDVNGPWDKEDV